VGHSKSFILKTFLMIISVSGCSTFRKTTLTSMAGSFAGGAILGATSAPAGDKEEMHGLLWGSLTAAAVGATLVYLHREDAIIHEKNREIENLKIRLEPMEGKKLIESGDSDFLERNLPPNMSKLIEPGRWRLYETDAWKKKSKNQYIHQDKVLEFNPPTIRENL